MKFEMLSAGVKSAENSAKPPILSVSVRRRANLSQPAKNKFSLAFKRASQAVSAWPHSTSASLQPSPSAWPWRSP